MASTRAVRRNRHAANASFRTSTSWPEKYTSFVPLSACAGGGNGRGPRPSDRVAYASIRDLTRSRIRLRRRSPRRKRIESSSFRRFLRSGPSDTIKTHTSRSIRAYSTCGTRAFQCFGIRRIARTGNSRASAFLDDALRHGIASGVSMPLFDEGATRIVVDFVIEIPDPRLGRETKIRRALGDMFIFGKYFHELLSTLQLRAHIQHATPECRLAPESASA